MIIKSQNFHIELGNGDGLCMGQIQNNDTYEIIRDENFLKIASQAILSIAEHYFGQKRHTILTEKGKEELRKHVEYAVM